MTRQRSLASRSAWPSAVIVALAACGSSPSLREGDDAASGQEGAPTTPREGSYPTPFLSGGGGEIEIATDRTTPVTLSVSGIVPGRTQAVVDGVARIVAGQPSDYGELTSDTLTLTLHGAMLAGTHTLWLQTSDGELTLTSMPLALELVGALPVAAIVEAIGAFADVPQPQGAGSPTKLVAGDRVMIAYAAVEPTGAAALVVPWDKDGALVDAHNVQLDGYVDDARTRDGVCAAWIDADEGAPRIALAWRWGATGDAVAVALRAPGALTGTITPDALRTLDLGDEALAIRRIDALACTRDAIFAEVAVTRDAERGDLVERAIATATWEPDDGEALTRAGLHPGLDLSLGGSVTWLAHDRARALIRVAQRVVQAAWRDGAGLLLVADLEIGRVDPVVPANARDVVGVAGSFDARHLLAIDEAGTWTLRQVDLSRTKGGGSTLTGDAPGAGPIGPPGHARVRGRPVFVIPRGDDEATTILTTAGSGVMTSQGPPCRAVIAHPPQIDADTVHALCLRGATLQAVTISLPD